MIAAVNIGGSRYLSTFAFCSSLSATKKHHDSADLKHRVLRCYRQIFIPLGVPVIAGPGAITTASIYGYQSSSLLTDIFLGLTLIGVLAILYATLLLSPLIQKITGDLPLNLVARVFGMILIAISVQFMVEGLTAVFPGLVGYYPK